MPPRSLLGPLLCLVVVTAGCVGTAGGPPAGTAAPSPDAPRSTADDPSATGDTPARAATPPPPGRVDLPDGPKERPQRPAELDGSSVASYVKAYEYAYVYNGLWRYEYSDVTVACRVDRVTERPWGYDVIVTCTGSSEGDPPEDSTHTPGPHVDWFTQSFRYSVSEDATARTAVENRDPVS